MNIAMLTTTTERCGVAAYSRALVEALRSLSDVNVEVIPIVPGIQPPAHYIEQAERANADAIDVVHIQHEHSFWGSLYPRQWTYWQVRYLIKKPLTLTAHTTYDAYDLLRMKTERRPHIWLFKTLLLQSKAFRDSRDIAPFVTAMTIVHTAAARNALIERGANADYVHVVPTGVPAPIAAPTGGRAFREKHNLQDRRIVSLFGYITPNKGYELTLEILPHLPEDVTFVIAGGARTALEEPYARQVQQRASASSQAHRILITGVLSDTDVAEVMEASDIVLAPHTQATGSYSITLPITHGRPILASDLDCFREIAGRVDCLELFPAGDPRAYQEKLLQLLGAPERRAHLSAEARRYAARFSWPGIAKMTQRIYGQAIDIYGRGHRPHWTGTPHAHFPSKS